MKGIGEKLIITKTVNELLFEGYDDIMLKLARKAKATQIPFPKFAWFYDVNFTLILLKRRNDLNNIYIIFYYLQRNNSASYDGTFNMLTGKSNLFELGIVKEWNFQDRVSYYPGECGIVQGTNGDLWPPLPDNKTISFFVSDICT